MNYIRHGRNSTFESVSYFCRITRQGQSNVRTILDDFFPVISTWDLMQNVSRGNKSRPHEINVGKNFSPEAARNERVQSVSWRVSFIRLHKLSFRFFFFWIPVLIIFFSIFLHRAEYKEPLLILRLISIQKSCQASSSNWRASWKKCHSNCKRNWETQPYQSAVWAIFP